jgi:hypothetical protein
MKQFIEILKFSILFWIFVWCLVHDIAYYFAKGWYKSKSKFGGNKVININWK